MFEPLPELGWILLRKDTELTVLEYLFRPGWLALAILLCLPLFFLFARPSIQDEILRIRQRLTDRWWRAALLLAVITATLSFALDHAALGGLPHTQDEIAYVFQARTMARGSIWCPAPPPGTEAAFRTQFILEKPSGWIGKYPVGWPAFLALFAAMGAITLANPFLNLVSLLLLARFLRGTLSPALALLGAALLAFSPFYIAQGAAKLSHPLGLLAILLVLNGWLDMRWGHTRGPFLIGLGVAILVLARPVEAPLILAVPLLQQLFEYRAGTGRLSVIKVLFLTGLPVVLAFLAVLAYQREVTGSPFGSPFLEYSAGDRPGFGPDVGTFDPEGHNVFKAAMNLLMNMLVLNEDLFGWPSLSLVPALLGFLLPSRWNATDRLLAALAGVIVAIYFCFMGHGLAFGARYYYAALPAWIWFTLRGLQELRRRGGESSFTAVLLLLFFLEVVAWTTYVPHRCRELVDYWNVLSFPEQLVAIPPEAKPADPKLVVIPALKLYEFRDLYDSFFTLNELPPGTGRDVYIRAEALPPGPPPAPLREGRLVVPVSASHPSITTHTGP